jgi:hypothetical protein
MLHWRALARFESRVAITALHGLRRVGKTTLAAACAERHRGDYRATRSIRAQSQTTMRADLVALGIRLGWVGAGAAQPTAAARSRDPSKPKSVASIKDFQEVTLLLHRETTFKFAALGSAGEAFGRKSGARLSAVSGRRDRSAQKSQTRIEITSHIF